MEAAPHSKTFAYIAHEAVHSPMEVPLRYIRGECEDLVGATYPTRRIYCGMVRAMDESVRNITRTYRELGILDETLVVLSADNGGEPGAGGYVAPAVVLFVGQHPSLACSLCQEQLPAAWDQGDDL